jgi:hypothetical protein
MFVISICLFKFHTFKHIFKLALKNINNTLQELSTRDATTSNPNRLTDANGFSVLCPIPVSGVVAPPPALAGQNVLWVAVKLDHRAGRERERALAAERGRGQRSAGNDWNGNEFRF